MAAITWVVAEGSLASNLDAFRGWYCEVILAILLDKEDVVIGQSR
jgi:hypothetical protein